MKRYGRSLPNNPSRRAIRNEIAAAKAMYAPEIYGAVVEVEPTPERRTPKRQGESKVNDARHDVMKVYRNVKLYRNSRGMAQLDSGAKIRIGIGPNGYPDSVGYVSRIVTQEMVGQRIAQFAAPESKVPGKDFEDHQRVIAQEIIADGGLAGVVRCYDDYVDVLGLRYL